MIRSLYASFETFSKTGGDRSASLSNAHSWAIFAILSIEQTDSLPLNPLAKFCKLLSFIVHFLG